MMNHLTIFDHVSLSSLISRKYVNNKHHRMRRNRYLYFHLYEIHLIIINAFQMVCFRGAY